MAFITITGQNQIAKKQGDGEALNIAMFVLANVPDLGSEPATRIESIPNAYVVDQLAVTKSGYVNTNQVVYSLVMGSNVGNYSFNWVGLVDDEGVLIAVTYIPLTPKTKNDGGVPGNTFTRNFLLAYTGIQQTTAITVPAETWQIDFSARLSGIDERERLSNLDIYGHEGFIDEGWKVTGSAGTYSVAAGIGYVGGVRAKNTAPQQITTTTFPNEIWLNVSLQGDISDMTAVGEFVIDAGPFADYVDGNGVAHYLTKIADIDESGDVFDGRLAYENLTQHEAKDDPHTQYQTKVLAVSQAAAEKIYVDGLQNKKRLFAVSGDADDIVLTSKTGETPIAALSDFDEFSFIVSATNTSSTVTIKVDDLDAVSLSGISSDTQIFGTALLTVRYIGGAFYIAEQINPKTGNSVADIAKLITDTTDVLYPGEYALDGSEINSVDHPIACAKAAASTNYVAQATKDSDPIGYGGSYGFVTEDDGSTTVTLPMVGGEFIRMFDDGRGVDSGRGFGSWEGSQNLSHNHSMASGGAHTHRYDSMTGSSKGLLHRGGSDEGSSGTTSSSGSHTHTIYSSGGDEARPRSIAYYGKTRL
jgi:hypothetical protein